MTRNFFKNLGILSIFFFVLNNNCQAQSFDQKGLKVKYYNSTNFKDSILISTDENINFDWKEKQPVAGIKVSSFSARWLGYIIPKNSEKYIFSAEASGLFKLWVNDSLIIDYKQKPSAVSGSINLTKGVQYSFRADFSNTSANAVCKLSWQSKSQKKQIIPATQFIPEGAEFPPVKVLTNVIGRDPFVTLGPDGFYYMIHTSCYYNGTLIHKNCWDNNDGLHLWKSSDMIDWKDLGLIWSIEENGTWEKIADEKGRHPLWSPEIHYIKSKKNWYIPYSIGTFAPIGIQTGLLKSTSGKPEGPYVPVTEEPIVKGIDGSLFEDTDGKVYFLHDDCQIALMNEDINGFTEPFRQLGTKSGKKIWAEGPGMIKIKDKYYLFAASNNKDMEKDTYNLILCVSDSIYGPYSERWMALRHAGHGTLFYDKKGDLWTSLFGTDDLSNVYITPSVVKMTVETNGKILPIRNDLRAKVILPTAEIHPINWKYTTSTPFDGWNEITFNDSGWQEAKAGFGKGGNSAWNTTDIWLRKTIDSENITSEEIENMVLSVSHNGAIEIYLNGIEACSMIGSNKYSLKKISQNAKASIKQNQNNVIAIHCKQEGKDQFVDAGLITWKTQKSN